MEETLGRALVAHIASVHPRPVGRWVEGERPRRFAEERLRTAFHHPHHARAAAVARRYGLRVF